MSAFRRPLLPAALLSLALALAGCGWEVPPVEELPPLVLTRDAGTPARPPPTTPTTPAGALPSAPVIVLATAGDGSVFVRWTAATGNGWPILSYQVTLSATSDGGTSMTTIPAPASELTFLDVMPGKAYTLTVSAITAVGTGPASTVIGLVPYVGSCKSVVAQSGGRARSGVHRISLGGIPVDVYCDISDVNGAWTLVLHSQWTGQLPTEPRLSQPLVEWRNWGVGSPFQFTGTRGSAPYVMPLNAMRALLEPRGSAGRTVRFESDNQWAVSQLFGTQMGADHSLTGYNSGEVAGRLCGGSSDCFVVAAPPFAASDSTTTPGSRCVSENHGLGWWYGGASCGRYHPFRTDSRPLFSDNTADPTTNNWTWWVQ